MRNMTELIRAAFGHAPALRGHAPKSAPVTRVSTSFSDPAPHDRWEADRRAVAAFYAAQGRYPRNSSPYPSERRLAAWVETERALRTRRTGAVTRELLLELTPGWRDRRSPRRTE
jgi:hypothetical protein